jgi:hypothetical protein
MLEALSPDKVTRFFNWPNPSAALCSRGRLSL